MRGLRQTWLILKPLGFFPLQVLGNSCLPQQIGGFIENKNRNQSKNQVNNQAYDR